MNKIKRIIAGLLMIIALNLFNVPIMKPNISGIVHKIHHFLNILTNWRRHRMKFILVKLIEINIEKNQMKNQKYLKIKMNTIKIININRIFVPILINKLVPKLNCQTIIMKLKKLKLKKMIHQEAE